MSQSHTGGPGLSWVANDKNCACLKPTPASRRSSWQWWLEDKTNVEVQRKDKKNMVSSLVASQDCECRTWNGWARFLRKRTAKECEASAAPSKIAPHATSILGFTSMKEICLCSAHSMKTHEIVHVSFLFFSVLNSLLQYTVQCSTTRMLRTCQNFFLS